MHRCLVPAAVLMMTVTFSTAAADAGWLSSHGIGQAEDCCPTCATPPDCHVLRPDCSTPISCAPVVPDCCTPNVPMYGGGECHEEYCGEIACDDSYVASEEGCIKRGFKKLMDLERRKNRCLIDTFFGRRDKHDGSCYGDCAPIYYYQAQGAAGHGCH